MAKVELVEKKESTKWEPFVTITLSKREAAGVHALCGASSSNVVPHDLYDELSELFPNEYDCGGLLVSDSSHASDILDSRHGPL